MGNTRPKLKVSVQSIACWRPRLLLTRSDRFFLLQNKKDSSWSIPCKRSLGSPSIPQRHPSHLTKKMNTKWNNFSGDTWLLTNTNTCWKKNWQSITGWKRQEKCWKPVDRKNVFVALGLSHIYSSTRRTTQWALFVLQIAHRKRDNCTANFTSIDRGKV